MAAHSKTKKIVHSTPHIKYSDDKGFDYLNPDPDYIMTYDTQGNPLSRYIEDMWEYGAYVYNPCQLSSLWFKKKNDLPDPIMAELTKEHRKLMAAMHFSTFSAWFDRPSPPRLQVFNGIFSRMKKECRKLGYGLCETLADPLKLGTVIDKLNANDGPNIKGILDRLVRANEKNFGTYFNIAATLPLLSKRGAATFQHPVIPSRILFEKLLSFKDVLDDYFKYEENFRQILNLSKLCHSYLVGQDWDYNTPPGFKKKGMKFERVAIEYGIFDLIVKYDINSVTELCNFLGKVQYCAMMTIVAYTGMRRSEALSLNYDCIRIKKRPYGRIRHIVGITTKLTRAKFHTSWVTSKHVMPAIRAAQSICSLAADSFYNQQQDVKTFPLFISRSYISFSHRRSRATMRPAGGLKSGALDPIYFECDMPDILMTKDDLDELKEVAPFQDWDGDGRFQVGQNWPITIHQLRRSLAVYAAKSGLVRHSSLRRQLKHLSVEMSLYYARGSSRVKSIFNPDRDHIMHDFTREKLAELDATLYIRDVLTRHEHVHGGHAMTLKAQRAQNDQQDGASSPITMDDKAKTLEDFKKGRIAWRPTIPGGCTSKDGCQTVAHPTLTKCFAGAGCNDAVILPEKVNAAIDMQHNLISVLDITSVEYRTELAQLEDLKRLKEEIAA